MKNIALGLIGLSALTTLGIRAVQSHINEQQRNVCEAFQETFTTKVHHDPLFGEFIFCVPQRRSPKFTLTRASALQSLCIIRPRIVIEEEGCRN